MNEDTGLCFAKPNSNILFLVAEGKEIMRLDEQGMLYNGQRIEDAGAAHAAFMEVMKQMKGAG